MIYHNYSKAYVGAKALNIKWIELDHAYCGWPIKWVVKKEIIQLAELCLQDDELQVVLDGTGLVYDDNGWYLVSISWYCLILGGTRSAKGL